MQPILTCIHNISKDVGSVGRATQVVPAQQVDSSSDEVPSLLYINDLAEEAPAPAGDAACPLILCKVRRTYLSFFVIF